MALKFKRYTHYEDWANCDPLTISKNGEWLKYQDVKKQLLKLKNNFCLCLEIKKELKFPASKYKCVYCRKLEEYFGDLLK
jgi:hypothetical protein